MNSDEIYNSAYSNSQEVTNNMNFYTKTLYQLVQSSAVGVGSGVELMRTLRKELIYENNQQNDTVLRQEEKEHVANKEYTQTMFDLYKLVVDSLVSAVHRSAPHEMINRSMTDCRIVTDEEEYQFHRDDGYFEIEEYDEIDGSENDNITNENGKCVSSINSIEAKMKGNNLKEGRNSTYNLNSSDKGKVAPEEIIAKLNEYSSNKLSEERNKREDYNRGSNADNYKLAKSKPCRFDNTMDIDDSEGNATNYNGTTATVSTIANPKIKTNMKNNNADDDADDDDDNDDDNDDDSDGVSKNDSKNNANHETNNKDSKIVNVNAYADDNGMSQNAELKQRRREELKRKRQEDERHLLLERKVIDEKGNEYRTIGPFPIPRLSVRGTTNTFLSRKALQHRAVVKESSTTLSMSSESVESEDESSQEADENFLECEPSSPQKLLSLPCSLSEEERQREQECVLHAEEREPHQTHIHELMKNNRTLTQTSEENQEQQQIQRRHEEEEQEEEEEEEKLLERQQLKDKEKKSIKHKKEEQPNFSESSKSENAKSNIISEPPAAEDYIKRLEEEETEEEKKLKQERKEEEQELSSSTTTITLEIPSTSSIATAKTSTETATTITKTDECVCKHEKSNENNNLQISPSIENYLRDEEEKTIEEVHEACEKSNSKDNMENEITNNKNVEAEEHLMEFLMPLSTDSLKKVGESAKAKIRPSCPHDEFVNQIVKTAVRLGCEKACALMDKQKIIEDMTNHVQTGTLSTTASIDFLNTLPDNLKCSLGSALGLPGKYPPVREMWERMVAMGFYTVLTNLRLRPLKKMTNELGVILPNSNSTEKFCEALVFAAFPEERKRSKFARSTQKHVTFTVPPEGMYVKGDMGYITFRIENVTLLAKESDRHYSPEFVYASLKWSLLCMANKDSLALYLCQTDSVHCKFVISVINQLDPENTITNEGTQSFSAFSQENDWGFNNVVKMRDLLDHSQGFMLNNTDAVEIEVRIVLVEPLEVMPKERLSSHRGKKAVVPRVDEKAMRELLEDEKAEALLKRLRQEITKLLKEEDRTRKQFFQESIKWLHNLTDRMKRDTKRLVKDIAERERREELERQRDEEKIKIAELQRNQMEQRLSELSKEYCDLTKEQSGMTKELDIIRESMNQKRENLEILVTEVSRMQIVVAEQEESIKAAQSNYLSIKNKVESEVLKSEHSLSSCSSSSSLDELIQSCSFSLVMEDNSDNEDSTLSSLLG